MSKVLILLSDASHPNTFTFEGTFAFQMKSAGTKEGQLGSSMRRGVKDLHEKIPVGWPFHIILSFLKGHIWMVLRRARSGSMHSSSLLVRGRENLKSHEGKNERSNW